MTNAKKRAAEAAAPAKTAKKRKTKAGLGGGGGGDDDALDMELGINTLFSHMDSQLVADHVARNLGRFGGDLSSVELSDLTVSGEIARARARARASVARRLGRLPLTCR